MDRRITIQWTTTAKDALKRLPKKVRKGLLAKADELLRCDDPKNFHKPLTGPLEGLYRMTYGRYRAIYQVEEQVLEDKRTVIYIVIRFVAAGIRKEHDKNDVYRVAEKLVALGLIRPRGQEDD